MSHADTPTSSLFAADRHVCVVLHDVAPSTRAACVRTLAAVADVANVPVTLLAVPRYHGEGPTAELQDWIGTRLKRGDEAALHGWTHRDDGAPQGLIDNLRRNHYTRSEGEFWALSEAEAQRRIADGIAWFRRMEWPLAGFVAPAWLLGPGAWAVLERQGFEYTATVRELVHLPGRRAVRSQSVVYSTSSGWRRQSSLLWNATVSRWERGNRLLRIELHPRDADFADIRRSWQKILERALRDRRPSTVADFMRQERASAATSVLSISADSTTGPPSTQFQPTRAE